MEQRENEKLNMKVATLEKELLKQAADRDRKVKKIYNVERQETRNG